MVQGSNSVRDKSVTKSGPLENSLYRNYPNPFNPCTTIRFNLPKAAHVRLSIYNLLGQEIKMLVDENRTGGLHRVHWDGQDARHVPLPGGVYRIRFETPAYCETRRLLLLK